MQKLIALAKRAAVAAYDKVTTEPVATRTFIGAVLTYLVASGTLDTALADGIEHYVTVAVDVLLVVSARGKVTPQAKADKVASSLESIADPAE